MKVKTIRNKEVMKQHIEQVWSLLSTAYENIAGGLHYQNQQHLITTTDSWKLIMHGTQIIALTVYKAKKGRKLVAMCINQKMKTAGKTALIKLIRSEIKSCWMELSGAAEHFVIKYCNGAHYILKNTLTKKLLGKEIYLNSKDTYHYFRVIQNIKKEKIIIGTPQFMAA